MGRRVKSAYPDNTQSEHLLIPYWLYEVETPWKCACALLKGLDHRMKFIKKPIKLNQYFLHMLRWLSKPSLQIQKYWLTSQSRGPIPYIFNFFLVDWQNEPGLALQLLSGGLQPRNATRHTPHLFTLLTSSTNSLPGDWVYLWGSVFQHWNSQWDLFMLLSLYWL